MLLSDSASRHHQYLAQHDTTLQQDRLLLQGQLRCMTWGTLVCLAGWLAAIPTHACLRCLVLRVPAMQSCKTGDNFLQG